MTDRKSTPVDLTDEQWRDRAFVLDALRTRLGELEEAAEAFGVAAHLDWVGPHTDFTRRDAANLRELRARQAVEDFVAAMHDHFAPIVPPPYPYPGSLDAFLAERHDLPMGYPWARDAEPPQPNPFGVCSDGVDQIDQGEGPEC